MMQGKAVLALWIDIDPAAVEECDDWYIKRHIADRIGISGWHRVRRFQGVQNTYPETLALYEVQECEDLISDDYLGLQRNVDALDLRMRSTFSNVARDTFRVRHSWGQGEGGMIISLRFEPDSADIAHETVTQTLVDGLLPGLAGLNGVVSTHLLQQAPEFRDVHDGHRKSGVIDSRVSWVLMIEVTRQSYAQQVTDFLRRWHTGQALGLSDGDMGVYSLMYAITRNEVAAI